VRYTDGALAGVTLGTAANLLGNHVLKARGKVATGPTANGSQRVKSVAEVCKWERI